MFFKTRPVQSEGEIYTTTNNFHITEDGLIFEGTEEDWQQSAAASVPLKIEDYKYQIDAISPSRTEVRLKSKNIKRALDAELFFYGSVFGFKPADSLVPVEIFNLPM